MANTNETLRNLLNKIATEHKYEKPEIIINEIFSGGANYTSKLYTVIVREENKDDLHLFAKVAATREVFRKDMPINPYKAEQFVYTKLAKIYASLEEEYEVPKEHRLYFTKFYGFDPTEYHETLVLENLLAHGYGPHNRLCSVNWEYASSAIGDLAKMHALSFAFSKQYPEEFKKTLASLKLDWEEFRSMKVLFQKTINVALENVKVEYKEALEKFLRNQELPFLMHIPIRKTAIVHGDFRGDNLLNRVQEDGKVDIKIVDLQCLHGGTPVTDIIYFIFSGTDEEFRAKYYDRLLDHYYTELSAAMMRLNLDPEETYSREDFEYELKKRLPYGLSLAVLMLPLITIDRKDVPEVDEILDMNAIEVDKISNVYADRLNGVVNDFVKWGILNS
ncbi:hypothetical protein PYW07_010080 [Mythimna separata]|uniref:CHK kinase-like domain-containing protein n=1 Tax=Mythimna separata TaxID=271217 RepID=A0AAD7YHZ9_MYTSE|nr:hypothetical protein PYW07_010080 [Mythimna separata]